MSITSNGRAVLDKLRVSQGLDPKLPWGGPLTEGLDKSVPEVYL